MNKNKQNPVGIVVPTGLTGTAIRMYSIVKSRLESFKYAYTKILSHTLNVTNLKPNEKLTTDLIPTEDFYSVTSQYTYLNVLINEITGKTKEEEVLTAKTELGVVHSEDDNNKFIKFISNIPNHEEVRFEPNVELTLSKLLSWEIKEEVMGNAMWVPGLRLIYKDCISDPSKLKSIKYDPNFVNDGSYFKHNIAPNRNPPLYAYANNSTKFKITEIIIKSDSKIRVFGSMERMFEECRELSDLSGLENWDVSEVTTMQIMFRNCTNLIDLSPLKDWDVSNVKDMAYMFCGCYKLVDLSPLKDWDVSKVKDMHYMFHIFRNLTDLSPLKDWDVSKVTDLRDMFGKCGKLTTAKELEDWGKYWANREQPKGSKESDGYPIFNRCPDQEWPTWYTN